MTSYAICRTTEQSNTAAVMPKIVKIDCSVLADIKHFKGNEKAFVDHQSCSTGRSTGIGDIIMAIFVAIAAT